MDKILKNIILKRKSVRAFLDKPVSNKLLKDLLISSSLAPSGGNLQPWKVFVINKKSMEGFLSFQEEWKGDDKPAYDIYPEKLKEPYRTERWKVGEAMYEALGIPRADKTARIEQVLKNYQFFGAPAAFFCFIDKQMGPPQWSDLGMFLQTFMLLAQESGLSTCAQEAWSLKQNCVKQFTQADDELTLFCGMSIGYEDENNPVNGFKTSRMPPKDWLTFL
jgi:nitroreductase